MNAAFLQTTWLTTLTQALGWTLVHFVWQGAADRSRAVPLCAFGPQPRAAGSLPRGLCGPGTHVRAAVSTLVAEMQAVRQEMADSSKRSRGKAPRSGTHNRACRGVRTEASRGNVSSIARVSTNVVVATSSTANGHLPDRKPKRRDRLRVAQIAAADTRHAWHSASSLICRGLSACGRSALSSFRCGCWPAGTPSASLRVAADATDSLWIERFNRLKTRLGVSYAVRLVFSTSAAVPMVIGWLKPVVLVPAGLVAGSERRPARGHSRARADSYSPA